MKCDLTEYTPAGWSNIWISGKYQWIPPLVGGGLLQWVNPLLFKRRDAQNTNGLSQPKIVSVQFENDIFCEYHMQKSNPVIFLPSALCFLLFFFFFFVLWLSTVTASAVCCSLPMKFSMSSKQWLRMPWGGRRERTSFVMQWRYEMQPEVTEKTHRWWGGVPLLSLLVGRRCRARRSLRLLLGKRGESSVDPFSFTGLLVFAASGIPAPLFTHATHPHLQTNTQSDLCAPEPFTLNTSSPLSFFPSHHVSSPQILLQQNWFYCHTQAFVSE